MIDQNDLSAWNKLNEPGDDGSPAKGIMSGAAIMTPFYVIAVSLILWIINRRKDR
jgi:hypothetical protein